jgi:hypothetical protein
MEEFESQFAELSFKVAKLKVSLRIKRFRTISEDDQNGSEQLDGELNPENVSRRSSISSTDSGFSSPLVRSRVNSVSSHKVPKIKENSRRASDCFVTADEEFERYFQPIIRPSIVEQPKNISCPVPKFRISAYDTSDVYI